MEIPYLDWRIVAPVPVSYSFLPFLGYHLDVNSVTALYVITAIVSMPFTLLAIFMNHKM